MNFPRYRRCTRCGATYLSASGFRCPDCQRRSKLRAYYRRQSHAPSTAQEARQQGDADLYQQALRGDLD